MKKLFLILALIAAPIVSEASHPAFDAAVSTTGTASSFVVSHTATGADLYMQVDVAYDPTTSFPVTAITYDGEPLTQLAQLENGTDQGLETWYAVGIATGANPVTVLLSASVKCTVSVRTYTNVDQVTPVHVAQHADVTGTSGAVTITTTEADTTIIGCAAWEGSGVITEDVSQTERVAVQVTGGAPSSRTTSMADDEEAAAPGSVVMSYSYTIGNPAVLCAVAIHHPAGAASPTPTSTTTPSPTPGPKVFMNPLMTGVPLFSVNPDTVSLLRFENNMRDEVGKYTWTLFGAATFDNSKAKENLYGVGEFDSAVSTTSRIVSGTITEAIKTIEFWMYIDWDSIGGNQYVYGLTVFLAHLKSATTSITYVSGVWSAEIALADDAWYYVAFTFDGVDIKMFIDNVERASIAAVSIPTNLVHTLGNHTNNALPCDCYLDYFRLSTVVRTNFPTSD